MLHVSSADVPDDARAPHRVSQGHEDPGGACRRHLQDAPPLQPEHQVPSVQEASGEGDVLRGMPRGAVELVGGVPHSAHSGAGHPVPRSDLDEAQVALRVWHRLRCFEEHVVSFHQARPPPLVQRVDFPSNDFTISVDAQRSCLPRKLVWRRRIGSLAAWHRDAHPPAVGPASPRFR